MTGFLLSASVAEAKALVELPVRYDLRDDGYVTPVKLQNPFGSCWAFGAIAAAESSILSGSGKTYAETIDRNGNGFDLSEKHLAWFAQKPISKYDDPTQVGEGIHLVSDNPNAPYSMGGLPVQVTTLFSSGTGPVMESTFPYRGKNGLTNYLELLSLNEEQRTAYLKSIYEPDAKECGMTLEEYCRSLVEDSDLVEGLTDYDPVKVLFDWAFEYYLNSRKDAGIYSASDDWSIPDYYKSADGTKYSYRNIFEGYTLKNGNILPDLSIFDIDPKAVSDHNDDGKVWKGINPDGIRAVKQELVNGRGVKISYCSEKATPDDIDYGAYMNEKTGAYYTFEDRDVTHAACIVGWDDTYSASNFKSGHCPPGDGAWLVKNSWGSETDYTTLDDGTNIGKGDWGIVDENGKHTGYFWLSYYDKTISGPESFEFTKTYNNQPFCTFQYDYLPSEESYCYTDDEPVYSANVFSLERDDPDIKISSVSAKTKEKNERVRFSVYKLKKGWKTPTDGTLIYQTSKNFEYAGYHRIEIPKGEQFVVNAGETIAVVNMNTHLKDNGSKEFLFCVNSGPSESQKQVDSAGRYWKGVVNKGESFVYEDGKWCDWSEKIKVLKKENKREYDNFSIKAFGTEVPEGEQVITAKNKTVTLKVGKKLSFAGGVKTSGNGKISFKKLSGKKGIVVTRDGKVYAKKGIKPGTYKLQVMVSASKTKEYRSAGLIMKLTVKVKSL